MHFIKTPNSITLFLNGELKTVTSDHAFYKEVLIALENGEDEKALKLMDFSKAASAMFNNRLIDENNTFTFDGIKLQGFLRQAFDDLVKNSQKIENFKLN